MIGGAGGPGSWSGWGTAAVLPGRTRRLPRSAIRRTAVAGFVLVLAGLLGAPAIDTRGLHRNALVALFAVPSVPHAGPRSSETDWRQSPIAPEELSATVR